MVDPNRKINRLTEKDIEFLDECQEEFANRFTENDMDFLNHCSKQLEDPPVVENWGYSVPGNSYRGDRGGQRKNYGGGNRFNRGGWNRRGRGHDRGYRGNDRGQHNKHNKPYDRPYDRNFRGPNEREKHPHQPMNIRRDYGNFVPASKE